MTVLFFSDNPWYSLTQRPQHLATRLAHRWPLVWIEPITLGHKRHLTPHQVRPDLFTVSVPLLPHNARQHAVRVAARHLGRWTVTRDTQLRLQSFLLRRALQEISLDAGPFVILIENFQMIDLVASFPSRCRVFDYIDDAFGFTDLPTYLYDAWVRTIRMSNHITATSPRLKQLILEAVPGSASKLHLLPNGVEYGRFAPEIPPARPGDLPPLQMPIIGYVGSVYPWLDFHLLECIATAFPEMALVIIGRAHPDVSARLSRLGGMKNFFYLGIRPYETVPAYLHHFDVGIIPFCRNQLTEAVNPVKLFEYSAAGVPTVSSYFSDDLKEFETHIFLSPSTEDFLANIQAALDRRHDQQFIRSIKSFAEQNTWDDRARSLLTLIDTTVDPQTDMNATSARLP